MAIKIKELRELGVGELATKRRELKEEAFNLRVQRESGQIENTARICRVRRDVAMIETVLTEKRSVAEQAAS